MRYKHQTRVGNWYERKVLEESEMKDYLEKKEKKQLISDKEEDIMRMNYEKVDLNNNIANRP